MQVGQLGRLGLQSSRLRTLLQQAIAAIRRNNGTLFYVPQNFAGAWTDNAGTDPVDAVSDVLGLMTDRSYGANNLGPELVDNSIGVIGSTYIIRGTSVAVGGGFYTVTGNSVVVSAVASPNPFLTFGKYYRITIEIAAGSSGPVNLHLSDAQNGSVVPTPFFSQSTPGVYGVTVTMDTADRDTITGFCGRTGTSTTFKVSVREILGAVATQATTANRPVVTRVPKRLGPNLVVNGAFDANLDGWANPDTAPSVTVWVAGQARMTAAAGGSLARLRQQVPVVAGKTYQASVSVMGITGTPSAALALGNASSGDVTYGNIQLSTAGRFAREVTPTGSIIGFAFIAGNATGGSITLDNIEVREVLEWSYAMSFDGSNDSLATNITTGNEGWVCAGVTFGGADSAIETVFHSGAHSVTTRGVWIARVGSISTNTLWCGVSDGTTRTVANQATITVKSVASVVEGGWTATTVFAGVNGAIGTTATRSGDATPPTNLAAIGVIAGGGGTYLNGPMTAQVICPVLPSAADRAIIRKWIGTLQGQSL